MVNSGNICGNSSRSTMKLDTSTLAAALACIGAFSNSGIDSEELDKLDNDNICRVPTEDTSDTIFRKAYKEKSLKAYKVRPLLDDDTTVTSLESHTNTSYIDDSATFEGSTTALTGGKEIKLTRKPSPKGKPLIGKGSKRKEGKIVRSVTIISSRKGTVEASLNPITAEDAAPKKKSILKPPLKNKLAKIVRKYKSNEVQQDKKATGADQSHPKEAVKSRSDSGVLTKVSLQIRSTDKGRDAENESKAPNPSDLAGEISDNAPSILGGDKTEVKSEAPSPSDEEFNSNEESSILAGFEINRIATNLISIIDRTLLRHTEATPSVSAKPIEEVTATDTSSPAENERQFKPKALNTVAVRTFYNSYFGGKTRTPDSNDVAKCDYRSNDEEQSLDFLPKPVGNEFLSDDGLPAPQNIENRLDSPSQTTEGFEEVLLQRTGSMECLTEASLGSEVQNNIVTIEENNNNDDSCEFEAVYAIRPPYKMSRDAE